MPETLKLDYQKTENYNALFQKLKRELFPDGEYQYLSLIHISEPTRP